MLREEKHRLHIFFLDPPPRFVSLNLGLFLCTDCSAVHRSMGPQVSAIRSLSDAFDDRECDVCIECYFYIQSFWKCFEPNIWSQEFDWSQACKKQRISQA